MACDVKVISFVDAFLNTFLVKARSKYVRGKDLKVRNIIFIEINKPMDKI